MLGVGTPMGQMNVSMTDHLASFVRRKVKNGRYNNASEVVRDALRRMQQDEAREARLAKPASGHLIADLGEQQRDSIRQLVRARIESVERGEYTDYVGPDGLQKLTAGVKARGRRLLSRTRNSTGK
jgi:antitoxin ParD1/3/4